MHSIKSTANQEGQVYKSSPQYVADAMTS